MHHRVLPVVEDQLEQFTGYANGSLESYLLILVFICAVTLVLHFLASTLGRERSLLRTSLVVVVASIVGLFVYSAVVVNVQPVLFDWGFTYLAHASPWVGLLLALGIVMRTVALRFIGLNIISLTVLLLMAVAAGMGTRYGAGLIMQLTAQAKEQCTNWQTPLQEQMDVIE